MLCRLPAKGTFGVNGRISRSVDQSISLAPEEGEGKVTAPENSPTLNVANLKVQVCTLTDRQYNKINRRDDIINLCMQFTFGWWPADGVFILPSSRYYIYMGLYDL